MDMTDGKTEEKLGQICEALATTNRYCASMALADQARSDRLEYQLRADERFRAMYGNIRVGSRVVLHRHRAVDPFDGTNWTDTMDRYIGTTAVVVEIPRGVDSAGCPGVRVAVGGIALKYFFRTRDVRLVDETAPKRSVPSARDEPAPSATAHPSDGVERDAPPIAAECGGRYRGGIEPSNEWMERMERMTEYERRCLGFDPALYGKFQVGSGVILGRHSTVDGRENWTSAMDAYVGKIAVISQLRGIDRAGCLGALVSVGGIEVPHFFRIRDMRLADGSATDASSGDEAVGKLWKDTERRGAAAMEGKEWQSRVDKICGRELPGYGNIRVGSTVVLDRHRAVNGCTNWSDDMDQYVDKTAVVVELRGVDSAGCFGVRVAIDGVEIPHFFRVRDMYLARDEPSAADTLVTLPQFNALLAAARDEPAPSATERSDEPIPIAATIDRDFQDLAERRKRGKSSDIIAALEKLKMDFMSLATEAGIPRDMLPGSSAGEH